MLGSEAREARLHALNTLLLSQVGEVVASEAWPSIKLGYRRGKYCALGLIIDKK